MRNFNCSCFHCLNLHFKQLKKSVNKEEKKIYWTDIAHTEILRSPEKYTISSLPPFLLMFGNIDSCVHACVSVCNFELPRRRIVTQETDTVMLPSCLWLWWDSTVKTLISRAEMRPPVFCTELIRQGDRAQWAYMFDGLLLFLLLGLLYLCQRGTSWKHYLAKSQKFTAGSSLFCG